MKFSIFVIGFLSIGLSLFGSAIDDLKTDKEVAAFLVSLDTNFQQKDAQPIVVNSTADIIRNKECNDFAGNWGVKNWEKADFNNDGLTDLLVNAYWYNYSPMVVIDLGNGKFKLLRLSYSPFIGCELAKTILTPDGQLVLFRTKKQNPDAEDFFTEKLPVVDTLIYKFGEFIELNNNPSSYKIDSLIFHSGTCLGTCPEFNMKVAKNGNVIYNAGMFSNPTGLFKGKITTMDLDSVLNFIDYLGIKKLRSKYAVSWTDSPTCNLTVKFSDGSLKNIYDYGEQGTFGLRRLYAMFFKLSTYIKWTKI